MKIEVELTEEDLKKLVNTRIQEIMGDASAITSDDIKIMVKTKQNYKAEWEVGNFKAIVSVNK